MVPLGRLHLVCCFFWVSAEVLEGWGALRNEVLAVVLENVFDCVLDVLWGIKE